MRASDANLLHLAQAIRDVEWAKAQGHAARVVGIIRAVGRYNLTCWSTLRDRIC